MITQKNVWDVCVSVWERDQWNVVTKLYTSKYSNPYCLLSFSVSHTLYLMLQTLVQRIQTIWVISFFPRIILAIYSYWTQFSIVVCTGMAYTNPFNGMNLWLFDETAHDYLRAHTHNQRPSVVSCMRIRVKYCNRFGVQPPFGFKMNLHSNAKFHKFQIELLTSG